MSQPWLKNFTREWRLHAIGVAIFIALTGLAYVLEFEPALRDRDAMRAGLAELADKRETISRLQATIHTSNAQIAALQASQAKELQLLPLAEINDRLSSLSALAAAQGLQVEAIEPGEASGSVRYSTIPIRINGRGRYPQFAKFLRALREELPDTSATDINFSSGGSTTAATFTLNLLWYAAPTPTVVRNETQ
jgi:Tfp pilus assembly protein PilO